MKICFIFFAFFLAACSSSHLVESHTALNEGHPRNKILIIGISENMEARRAFENGLQEMLKKESLQVVPSLEYFEPAFIYKSFSEKELLELEKQLLKEGFDAVLITRLEGAEEKIAEAHPITAYKNFREDYYTSQIYLDERLNNPEPYTVYHTQTSLYDLSEDTERALVWTGDIDVVNPTNVKRDVKQYLKLLLKTLKDEEILL